jgi:hypothetical protein
MAIGMAAKNGNRIKTVSKTPDRVGPVLRAARPEDGATEQATLAIGLLVNSEIGLLQDKPGIDPRPGNSKIDRRRDKREIDRQLELVKTGLRREISGTGRPLETLETDLPPASARTGPLAEILPIGPQLDLVEINLRVEFPKTARRLEQQETGLQPAEETSLQPDGLRVANPLSVVHHLPAGAPLVVWAMPPLPAVPALVALPAVAAAVSEVVAVVEGAVVAVEEEEEAADETPLKTSFPFFSAMNISKSNPLMPKTCSCLAVSSSLLLILTFARLNAANAANAELGKPFATPEAAVSALTLAANSGNSAELHNIFGPEAQDLQNPDRVQATNEMAAFAAALSAKSQIVPQSDTNCELDIGTNSWPFPVPLIKQGESWYFNTAAGKEELLNRRIGDNELAALAAVRGYVDAQREYASKDRNDDEVLDYAQKLISLPGKKDGLYWPTDLDGEISPLGPLIADAQAEGYNVQLKGQAESTAPFHGYYFKILTSQGKHAPGGQYSYIINGHMIGGFALLAWPAEYGNSGVMTFIVNQRGRVYQKDLGPNTDNLASAMTTYDPGPGWKVSPD